MHRTDYSNIGETLYSAELKNGLSLFVIPKKGFQSCFAVFDQISDFITCVCCVCFIYVVTFTSFCFMQ